MKNRERARDSEPVSWPVERGTDPPVLMSSWPRARTRGVVAEAMRAGADADLAAPVWEEWYDRALDAGVDDDLASLGRDLIRAAWAHRWEDARVKESGWLDEGEGMIRLASRDPDRAAARWRELLDD